MIDEDLSAEEKLNLFIDGVISHRGAFTYGIDQLKRDAKYNKQVLISNIKEEVLKEVACSIRTQFSETPLIHREFIAKWLDDRAAVYKRGK